MASTAYSAELRPDFRLRRFVLTSGIVLHGIGFVILATQPWTPALRLLAVTAWCLASYCELARLRRGWQRCFGIRLSACGAVAVRNRDGEWLPADLLDGCVLLRRYGWIRLRLADGSRVQELCSGERRADHDWRRLHVIWRHVGASG